ncbi:hypothetical protein D3C77_593190 [compost metagenome]
MHLAYQFLVDLAYAGFRYLVNKQYLAWHRPLVQSAAIDELLQMTGQGWLVQFNTLDAHH